MKIISTALEMAQFSALAHKKGERVSFVPTMGALHAGHTSLVKAAIKPNASVVVSVFVNPMQFNDANDLINYPRTIEADRELLMSAGATVMFNPTIEEIYPDQKTVTYTMDGLDTSMEGLKRPGHFDGVVRVVTRLFDIVNPDEAYFGQKDFQQLAIIRHMSKKLGYRTHIKACPTVREVDGLAMSSRNTRLTTQGRAVARELYQALQTIKNELSLGSDVPLAKASAVSRLNSVSGVKLEYLELVDPETLTTEVSKENGIQACIAAWVDGVRLIDNMRVK